MAKPGSDIKEFKSKIRSIGFGAFEIKYENFENAHLEGIVIHRTEITDQVDLKGAHFEGSHINESTFGLNSYQRKRYIDYDVNLKGAHFDGAILEKVYFRDVNLEFTHFTDASFYNKTEFRECNLSNADFTDCKFYSGTFRACNLSNANFTGADLTDVVFTNGNIMTGANFTGATLTRTEFPSDFEPEPSKTESLKDSWIDKTEKTNEINLPTPSRKDPLKTKLIQTLQKFSKEEHLKTGTKNWVGSFVISTLYYIYLLRKYKSNCYIINKHENTGSFEILYIGLDIELTNTRDYHHTQFHKTAKQLINCINRNVSTIIIPVNYRRPGSGGGHANLLIYRRVDNMIEHFEPHGSVPDSSQDNFADLVKSFVDTLNELLAKESKPPIIYQPPDDICPQFKGLQVISENNEDGSDDGEDTGYCLAWSIFFAEIILQNPTVSSATLFRKIYTIINGPKGHDYLKKMIKGYTDHIREKLGKYLLIIEEANLELQREGAPQEYQSSSWNSDSIKYLSLTKTFKDIVNLEFQLLNEEIDLRKEKSDLKKRIQEISANPGRFYQLWALELNVKLTLLNNLSALHNVNEDIDEYDDVDIKKEIIKRRIASKKITALFKNIKTRKLRQKEQEQREKEQREKEQEKEQRENASRKITKLFKNIKTRKLHQKVPVVVDNTPTNPCPPGKKVSEKTGKCINDPEYKKQQAKLAKAQAQEVQRQGPDVNTSTNPCPPGKKVSEKTGKCINDPEYKKQLAKLAKLAKKGGHNNITRKTRKTIH